MTEEDTGPIPTQIHLKQKSRLLELVFDDGSRFELPCEYLRVFSPSAEVRAAWNRGELVAGKETVNITRISPVGSYAVQLVFDDGHDSGIYSWKTLYELGMDYERNWSRYLADLEAAGLQRGGSAPAPAAGPRKVRLLYFVTLPEQLGREREETVLPVNVGDVGKLLEWLRRRGAAWDRALGTVALKITVNKQFAQADTPIHDGDEIAIVPTTQAAG